MNNLWDDKLHEECGVFGIYGHPEAARMTYLGLYALQHRGQESCGIAVSNGSRLFDGFVADHDGTLTERLKAAGVVIAGRSNTPEFGLACTTEPVRFGPTRNPWNLQHSAGGSSGAGSASGTSWS